MAMAMRVESVEEAKQAAILPGAQEQRRTFPAGMLKLFLGLMLFGVVMGLSAFGVFLARHAGEVAAAAPALFRPCLGAAAAEPEPEEGLERWTRPPARAQHAMTDEELLWLASYAPRARAGSGYPFRRVPKVAFMFLTHGPLPLAPLWERFFRGNEGRYSIYVHTMPLYRANFTADSVFYRRQIPSQVSSSPPIPSLASGLWLTKTNSNLAPGMPICSVTCTKPNSNLAVFNYCFARDLSSRYQIPICSVTFKDEFK